MLNFQRESNTAYIYIYIVMTNQKTGDHEKEWSSIMGFNRTICLELPQLAPQVHMVGANFKNSSLMVYDTIARILIDV